MFFFTQLFFFFFTLICHGVLFFFLLFFVFFFYFLFSLPLLRLLSFSCSFCFHYYIFFHLFLFASRPLPYHFSICSSSSRFSSSFLLLPFLRSLPFPFLSSLSFLHFPARFALLVLRYIYLSGSSSSSSLSSCTASFFFPPDGVVVEPQEFNLNRTTTREIKWKGKPQLAIAGNNK